MKSSLDRAKIKAVLERLRVAYAQDPSRRWWHSTLFHFTDVHNAAQILEDGYLLSRNLAQQANKMSTDNASPTVINQTSENWKDYVRFYFRPRTPTQFHNEGFRPKSQRTLGGAHCPVPVFFLFDSESILNMKESSFSLGSLASRSNTIYNTGDMFEQIQFDHVYHDSSINPQTDWIITSHRQAEVVIPNKCSLEHLKRIVCRSPAERETLIELLSMDAYLQYVDKIVVDTRWNLFRNDWFYVEKVNLTEDAISFSFNEGTKVVGTFNVFLAIEQLVTSKRSYYKNETYTKRTSHRINLKTFDKPMDYKAKLYIDDQLAYSGVYFTNDDLPF